jgi:hypothetical protein
MTFLSIKTPWLQLFTQDKHRCTSYFLLLSLANSLLKLRIVSPKIKILERNFPFRHVRKHNKHQRMIKDTKRKKISFKTRELTLLLHINKPSIQFLQNRIITLPISPSKHKTSESNILQTRLSETIIKVILPRRPQYSTISLLIYRMNNIKVTYKNPRGGLPTISTTYNISL